MRPTTTEPAARHLPPTQSGATAFQGVEAISGTTTAVDGVPKSIPSTTGARSNILINRNFALLWGGQALSILGNMLFNTTLVIWIASQVARGESWAPLAVSGVLFAASIPAFVIGPLAGVVVDRKDKRLMMLAMDGSRVFIAAALILATGAIPLPLVPGGRLPLLWTLGVIYVIVFLINSADQCSRRR
jgi:hypothetical protein